ncbi:MAG TPA: ABC transporter permease [Longimicrobiales bacterium]|nr:ABC transporter permease [Longimicrobiales bacterium]
MNGVRQVLRGLARRPGFTTVTVLTLAVGIGSATAVFSVADTVLLRPLPFPEPERLVRLEQRREQAPDVSVEAAYVDVVALDQELDAFDGVAAWASGSGRLVELGDAVERVPGKVVTWNFSRVLGVEPLRGRLFEAEDGAPGAAPVVVLHEALWRRRFGADPGVVGSTIRLEATPGASGPSTAWTKGSRREP